MDLIGMNITKPKMQKENEEAELWSCYSYALDSSESPRWVRAGDKILKADLQMPFAILEKLHGQPNPS